MATAKPTIKLARIREEKPVKVTVTIPHDLNQDLQAYARIYEQAYGEKQSVSTLIPSMLTGFLTSDAGFKKAKRELG